MPLYVHLDPESPRADRWKTVFGTLSLPILSPIPELRYFPELDNDDSLGLFFLVDPSRLDEAQLARLSIWVANMFDLDIDNVRADYLNEHGIPILANSDLTITDQPP
jgi:hypothetical protein